MTEIDYKKIVENIERWIKDEKTKRWVEDASSGKTYGEFLGDIKDLTTIENFIAGDDY